MRNQTNNVFKVKRQKSKLFITILCIFGLLFSYSCQCKNNVSDPNNIPPNGTNDIETTDPTVFSASLVDANSVKTLVVKSDGGFNKEIVLKISSTNTIDTITPTAVSENDLNLTAESFAYAKDTGKLTIRGIDDFKNQTGGTKKTITATFTLTTKDDNLKNTSTTVDVNLDLIRAVDTSSDTIENNTILKSIFTSLGQYQYDNNHVTFLFNDSIKVSANEITIENSASRNITKEPEGDINQFGTDIANDLNGENYGKGYFSSVTFDYNSSTISGTIATLSFDFTLSDAYGSGNGTFTIKADVKLPTTAAANAGKGSWKPKESSSN